MEEEAVKSYMLRIKLIVVTHDSRSTSEIKAPNVTDDMIDAAWDLVYTMSTGKRRKPKARFKLFREQREREAAMLNKHRAAEKAKRQKRIKTKLTKRKAFVRALKARENVDPIGLHSMVEGNRSDEQT